MLSDDVAVKNDQDKLRFELLSVPALRGLASVLTKGAKIYSDHNWRKGFEWSRLYGAALRHLLASMAGEDVDPETGELHVDHLQACSMFLSEHQHRKIGKDDRFKFESASPLLARYAALIKENKRIEKVMSSEGAHRRQGQPAGITEERVMEALREPCTATELAKTLGVKPNAGGYWIHKLKPRLLPVEGKDTQNRRVVRYVAA